MVTILILVCWLRPELICASSRLMKKYPSDISVKVFAVVPKQQIMGCSAFCSTLVCCHLAWQINLPYVCV